MYIYIYMYMCCKWWRGTSWRGKTLTWCWQSYTSNFSPFTGMQLRKRSANHQLLATQAGPYKSYTKSTEKSVHHWAGIGPARDLSRCRAGSCVQSDASSLLFERNGVTHGQWHQTPRVSLDIMLHNGQAGYLRSLKWAMQRSLCWKSVPPHGRMAQSTYAWIPGWSQCFARRWLSSALRDANCTEQSWYGKASIPRPPSTSDLGSLVKMSTQGSSDWEIGSKEAKCVLSDRDLAMCSRLLSSSALHRYKCRWSCIDWSNAKTVRGLFHSSRPA